MYLIIFRVPKPVHKLTVMIISPLGSDVAKVYCLYLCEVYLLALDLQPAHVMWYLVSII